MAKAVFSICVMGVLLFQFVGDRGVTAQDDGQKAPKQPTGSVANVDWSKEFDPTIETDPSRRMLARQYAALKPFAEQRRELFVRERVSAISLLQLEVRQLEIRNKLERNLEERKKCVEAILDRLRVIHQSLALMLERPAPPGNPTVQRELQTTDDLVDSTLGIIRWEAELESIDQQLSGVKQ